MRNRRKIILLVAVVTGMIWLANGAREWFVNQPSSNKNSVIFVDDYYLSGTYADSLAVVAEQAALAGGSRVSGDAALVGNQQAQVDGAIDGNLTLVGETLTLGADGKVSGDLSAMGDQITIEGIVNGRLTVIGDTLVIASDARVLGEIVACTDTITDLREDVPPIKPCQDEAALLALFTPIQQLSEGFDLSTWAASGGVTSNALLSTLSASLLLTGLSALAIMAFPRQFSHIHEAMLSTPRRLTALGCMTLLLAAGLCTGVAAIVTVAPVLGLVLVPLGLLLGLSLLIMIVTGWITLALMVGDLALRQLTHSILPPVIEVAFGSLLLFVLWHVLAIIPFGGVIGLAVMVMLGAAGLGGTLMTRLGTRSPRRQHFVQG